MVKLNYANDAQEQATLFARMQKEAGRKALMAASIPVNSFFSKYLMKDFYVTF